MLRCRAKHIIENLRRNEKLDQIDNEAEAKSCKDTGDW